MVKKQKKDTTPNLRTSSLCDLIQWVETPKKKRSFVERLEDSFAFIIDPGAQANYMERLEKRLRKRIKRRKKR